MNKIITLLFAIGLTALSACKNEGDPEGSLPSSDQEVKDMSEEELMRLAMLIEPNPGTYQEDQMNQLVQYAIDRSWPALQSESGLLYYVKTEGEGDSVSDGGKVMVQYKGYLLDGRVFDSSYERGRPSTFSLDEVIPAWQEGLRYIREGGTIHLLAISDLGYGARGASKLIKPYTPLIFEIELVEVL